MRNLVVLFVVGLLGWLGYQKFFADPARAEDRGGQQAPADDGSLPPLVRGDVKTASDPVGGGGALEAEAARLVHALQKGDFGEVGLDAGRRTELAGAPAALYALEVGLAGERADGASAELQAAADGLFGALAPAGGPELCCAGYRALGAGGRLRAAVDALGSGNGFLATAEARDRQAVVAGFLQATAKLAEEERILLSSRFLERMTSGGPVWDEGSYALLVEVVKAHYATLDGLLLSSSGSWRSRHVEVGPGDTLDGICNAHERKYDVPIASGFLMLVNRIQDPRRIRKGQKLRIPTGRMKVVVSKSAHSVRIYVDEVLVRLYQVGVGRKGHETPAGSFVVSEKQERPIWYAPDGKVYPYGDPRNVLGEYFLKLDHPVEQGFGIHGTDDQTTVGRDSSLGCLRLRKDDMAEVFRIVPRKTLVEILD